MVTVQLSENESNKMEVLFLSYRGMGPGIQLPALSGALLVPALNVRSLGLILDASYTMEAQISFVAQLVFYHYWPFTISQPQITAIRSTWGCPST